MDSLILVVVPVIFWRCRFAYRLAILLYCHKWRSLRKVFREIIHEGLLAFIKLLSTRTNIRKNVLHLRRYYGHVGYVTVLFVLCHVNVYSNLAESFSSFFIRDIAISCISKHKRVLRMIQLYTSQMYVNLLKTLFMFGEKRDCISLM
jgi:hypothetical protein